MIDNPPVPSPFEHAADAVVAGDAETLESLLHQHPDLSRARSTRVHRATLLHYVGANGVESERQKCPANAVTIAEILLRAGSEADAVADMYDGSTTLGLVASSLHPLQAGVQIPLLDLLLAHGAEIDGVTGSSILAALRNGRGEAARFLAERGARLDLESAAGAGQLDAVKIFFFPDGSLAPSATRDQLRSGFFWASEYGHDAVIEFLLSVGADLNAADTNGQTALHWAAVGGQAAAAQLLIERGAPLEAVNGYGGTPLGQALWSAIHHGSGTDYLPVIETLIRAGAHIDQRTLTWFSQNSYALGGAVASIALKRSRIS